MLGLARSTPAALQPGQQHETSDKVEIQTATEPILPTQENIPHESPEAKESVDNQRQELGVNQDPVANASSKPSASTWTTNVVPAQPDCDPKQLQDVDETKIQPRPWKTTLLRHGPLTGIASMWLAIAGIAASLGILRGSDKQAVQGWTVTPSTYIAAFTAIANLSMRYAAIQGVAIAWWCRGLKGSTASKLHWDWRGGTTLIGALTSGRHMGMLGLACIFSTVVVIDGPLLQRSTTVVSAPITNEAVELEFNLAPELPHGFSGGWYNGSSRWSYAFNDTIPTPGERASNLIWAAPLSRVSAPLMKSWYEDRPFQGIVRGCPGECRVKLKAPALFATACASHIVPSDFHVPVNLTATYYSKNYAAPLDHEIFVIVPNLVLGEDREVINLATGYWTGEHCSGVFNLTVCTLEAGIGKYAFTVKHDGSAELDPQSALLPEFVSFANNTSVSHTKNTGSGTYWSTLGGVVSMVYDRMNDVAFMSGGENPLMYSLGAQPPDTYMAGNTWSHICPNFADPSDDVMRSANKLMVSLGALAAIAPSHEIEGKMDPGMVINSTVTGQLLGSHNVFHSDYRFFVGAAIVELICIAFIAPTYWGWWKLGRPVSFSPLEVAKAFDAPLLAGQDSNSSARNLAKALGDTRVRYGATSSTLRGGELKLAFANPWSVIPPEEGSRYNSH